MKFVLAGYFGSGNFGDEAILKYFVDVIRFYYKEAEISVIGENPYFIKKNLLVNAISRFDFKNILKAIKNCNYLIFPGGSVLQDVTSLRSIFYYLALIFLAIIFKRKFILLAQGIGPIRNSLAKKFTYEFLRKASVITVRDEKSYNVLQENAISSELTADFLWAFTQNNSIKNEKDTVVYGDIAYKVEKKKLGVQLRHWENLTHDKLEIIAKNILKAFPYIEYDYKLICLQKKIDREVLISFAKIIKNFQPDVDIEMFLETDITKNVEILQSMDYMIAMRFHAGLCVINAEKPLLMISYDPKTEEFCKEFGMDFVDINNLTDESMKKSLIWLKEFNPTRTALKTNILVKKSQQNVDFLVKEIL